MHLESSFVKNVWIENSSTISVRLHLKKKDLYIIIKHCIEFRPAVAAAAAYSRGSRSALFLNFPLSAISN
jgi:hypothetical protein